MWALRRSSLPLKSQAFSVITFHACRAKAELASSIYMEKTGFSEASPHASNKLIFSKTIFSSADGTLWKHGFSSQAGRKRAGEEDDDLEDGFSEHEICSANVTHEDNVEFECDSQISETDLSEAEDDIMEITGEGSQNELEVSDTEEEAIEISPQWRSASSGLFKAVAESPVSSVQKALDKWVEEGNNLTRTEIYMVMRELRKRKIYVKALMLSKWLESQVQVEFGERDYASRLDLIAKVHSLQKAENCIKRIPKSFRGEIVYRTLLANCVTSGHKRKAEQVFNKMKNLKFPITTFTCNQLILLYKRTDRKKIADVLLLMEKEDIKPSIFTYRTLIDAKGLSNDIPGMEQIVEMMKAEGIKPTLKLQTKLAMHYAFRGFKEKAKLVLQEVERSDLKKNRLACSYLLSIYGALGSADDVKRVWEVCESDPRFSECLSAIRAWGTLNKVEEAEKVFDQMSKKWEKIPSKTYDALLKVYANNNMLSKGKDLVKQMVDSGCQIGPVALDSHVKLYVEAGETEKADLILSEALLQNKNRKKPLFNTYMMLLSQYAEQGDVDNAEKIFQWMRKDGYISRFGQYSSLLQTYINAKVPAYGFRERLKADNIFPNKFLAGQLAQVDPFKKTTVSHVLDL